MLTSPHTRRGDRMGDMNGYALLPAGFFLSKLFLFFNWKMEFHFYQPKYLKLSFHLLAIKAKFQNSKLNIRICFLEFEIKFPNFGTKKTSKFLLSLVLEIRKFCPWKLSLLGSYYFRGYPLRNTLLGLVIFIDFLFTYKIK